MAFRAALLGIYHESNTFIDTPTTMVDFEHGHLLVGEAIRSEYHAAHHEIGGMLEAMENAGIEVVPVLFAEATPGGVITAETYTALVERMFAELEKAGSIHACLVAVHGAAVCEAVRDMDGDWLMRLRQRLGSDVPIVGTLDLHANVSQKMVDATNALVSYKENPHLDQRARGKDAGEILARILKDEALVFQHLIQVPVAISIEQQFTQNDPCKSLYGEADLLSKENQVLAISVALGFPYADVREMGTSIIVVTEDDADLAFRLATELERYIWQNRTNYVGKKNSVEDVISSLPGSSKPVLLLDMGDNIGGGSPGNGLSLARALEAEGSYKYFCYLHDPDAVGKMESRNAGDTFPLVLNGFDETGKTSLEVEVKLISLGDGVFREDVPRHGGQVRYDMGKIAIVKTNGGGTLMLSALRVPPFSLKQITSFGICPEEFDVLIAKGVNAPIAAYSPVCGSILQVDTPGVTQADMTRFTYRYRRSPLYPFEEKADAVVIESDIIKTPFYTEGPVVDAKGFRYFTDLKGGSIFRIDGQGIIGKWADMACPNGQTIDKEGFHLVCDSKQASVEKIDEDGKLMATLVSGCCAGNKVDIPNDVVADQQGGFYFTDSVRHEGKVFYVNAAGQEHLVADRLNYPNGIALSENGDILYIAESYANRILRFTSGSSTHKWTKTIFADLPKHPSGKPENNLPDGIAFDPYGRLWVAHYGMGVLQVLSSGGALLATISTGFPLVSNVCYVPEENSLLVTGGFGEPGPGAILSLSLASINQYIKNGNEKDNH